MEPSVPLWRVDHRSEHGAWSLLRRPPPAALAAHVLGIQGYSEEGGRPVIRTETPTTMIPLILVFGPGFAQHDPSGKTPPQPLVRSFVAGLHRHAVAVGSEGSALCMQVNLTLAGARRLLGLELAEIAGRVVELREILGPAADALEARLAETRDWPERFAVLEAFLAQRILGAPEDDPLVAAALRAIERTGGGVRVGRLARVLGCSRKHLSGRVRLTTGLAPKTLARLTRFDRAMTRIREGRAGSLADLAASCGYADQAHFTRDFRSFAGESPTRLIRRALPDGTGILADLR